MMADGRMRLRMEEMAKIRDAHGAVLGQGEQDLEAGRVREHLEDFAHLLDGVGGDLVAGWGDGGRGGAGRRSGRARPGANGARSVPRSVLPRPRRGDAT